MRSSSAETRPDHPDPGLRPRVYEDAYDNVLRSCIRAAQELDSLEFAEADPRRGVLEAWVLLAPLHSLPFGLGPKKHPHARGVGWFHRFEPMLAKGWLQVRVEPAEKGRVRVSGQVRLALPFARPLARFLLKKYLRWLDLRRGEPVRA